MNNWKYEYIETEKNPFGEFYITHSYSFENNDGKLIVYTDKDLYFFIVKFQPKISEFKSKRNFYSGVDDTIRVKFGNKNPRKFVVSCLYDAKDFKFLNMVQISESIYFIKNMLLCDELIIEYNDNPGDTSPSYISFKQTGFLDGDNPVIDVYNKILKKEKKKWYQF